MSRRRKQVVMAMGAALVAVTVIVVFTVRFVLTPTITIRGRAVLLGAPPPPAVRNLSNLPPGAPAPADESLLVAADGGLANVFVYLEEGAAGSPGVAGEAVLVKQRQYNLHPRVLGVRVGQSVTFVNPYPFVHNVRCAPRNGPGFNVGLPPEGSPISKTFAAAEIMVRMQCDVHAGEEAFAGVLDHPYFAVTGPDGMFAFPEKLRPGIYTVVACHEKLGKLEQRVVCLAPTETLLFSFDSR